MDEMEMKPVVSSQIAELGYSADAQRMRIRFAPKADGSPGALYEYTNVEPEVFLAMDGAESIGSFFYANIKKNQTKYPYVRVDAITVLEAIAAIGKYSDIEKMSAYMERLPEEAKRDDRVPAAFKVRLDAIKAKHKEASTAK